MTHLDLNERLDNVIAEPMTHCVWDKKGITKTSARKGGFDQHCGNASEELPPWPEPNAHTERRL